MACHGRGIVWHGRGGMVGVWHGRGMAWHGRGMAWHCMVRVLYGMA